MADAPPPSLNGFALADLAPFTREKSFGERASPDFRLFYVGRDDVHSILKYVFARAASSIYLNMFGFDDAELNAILMAKALDPHVAMAITLDQSQAGGAHEKALLDADRASAAGLAAFNTHFVIGQSATHRISHTKGFVIDGRLGGEGSTNWSDDGEGTFVVAGAPGGAGYAAQNNTQTLFTDPDAVARFQAELICEHLAARKAASPS